MASQTPFYIAVKFGTSDNYFEGSDTVIYRDPSRRYKIVRIQGDWRTTYQQERLGASMELVSRNRFAIPEDAIEDAEEWADAIGIKPCGRHCMMEQAAEEINRRAKAAGLRYRADAWPHNSSIGGAYVRVRLDDLHFDLEEEEVRAFLGGLPWGRLIAGEEGQGDAAR